MNKQLLLLLPVLALAATQLSLRADDSYPPEGWMTDFPAAVEKAKAEGKMILIDFTGSDWCGWCIRLDQEVFDKKAFQDYAKENLVLVYLDFPNDIELSEEQQEQNQALMQFFGVRGFPTVWLLSNDLSPLLQTGYQDGGAEKYIEHLKKDRPTEGLTEDQVEEFRTALSGLVSELDS